MEAIVYKYDNESGDSDFVCEHKCLCIDGKVHMEITVWADVDDPNHVEEETTVVVGPCDDSCKHPVTTLDANQERLVENFLGNNRPYQEKVSTTWISQSPQVDTASSLEGVSGKEPVNT